MTLLRTLSRQPRKFGTRLTRLRNKLNFRMNGVRYGRNCCLEGRIWLSVRDGSVVCVGSGCHISGGRFVNRIGRNLATSLSADRGASLIIGDGCGISSSCIWARRSIIIGNNVNIGADCVILDHDAHSLVPEYRRSYSDDFSNTAARPVTIGDDVLIGTKVIVLKGVTIGERAVVGAGSVVACDIPAAEVWAGNPAKFIRKI